MKIKKRKLQNPAAKAVRTARFKMRVIRSKRLYRRVKGAGADQ